MEKPDLLRIDNQVKVAVLGPDNNRLFEMTNTGFRSVEAAIKSAIEEANLAVNPEDCVFEVSDLTTGVSHRYRLNAHGNLKLIV